MSFESKLRTYGKSGPRIDPNERLDADTQRIVDRLFKDSRGDNVIRDRASNRLDLERVNQRNNKGGPNVPRARVGGGVGGRGNLQQVSYDAVNVGVIPGRDGAVGGRGNLQPVSYDAVNVGVIPRRDVAVGGKPINMVSTEVDAGRRPEMMSKEVNTGESLLNRDFGVNKPVQTNADLNYFVNSAGNSTMDTADLGKYSSSVSGSDMTQRPSYEYNFDTRKKGYEYYNTPGKPPKLSFAEAFAENWQQPWFRWTLIIGSMIVVLLCGWFVWWIYARFIRKEEVVEEDESSRPLCLQDENGEKRCLTNAHALTVLNGDAPLHVYVPIDSKGNTVHHTEEENRLKQTIKAYDNQLAAVRADVTQLGAMIAQFNDRLDVIE